MNKLKVLICCSMLLATVLGVYGQGISYYASINLFSASPVILLSVITFISISLFIFNSTLSRLTQKDRNKNKQLAPYVTINNIIGIPVSVFSLFVLIMWWG